MPLGSKSLRYDRSRSRREHLLVVVWALGIEIPLAVRSMASPFAVVVGPPLRMRSWIASLLRPVPVLRSLSPKVSYSQAFVVEACGRVVPVLH